MPMYEFHCPACDDVFEELVRKADEEVRCPRCNTLRVERLLSRVAFSVEGKFTASTGASSCGGCTASSCGGCSSAS